MAIKRVFQIAKDLGVNSKAIVEKCQAEAIPNIENHMSAVSAGLEATIREWFSSAVGEATPHTAVETAEPVKLDAARTATKRARAKKAGGDGPHDTDAAEAATAVAEPEAPPAAPVSRPKLVVPEQPVKIVPPTPNVIETETRSTQTETPAAPLVPTAPVTPVAPVAPAAKATQTVAPPAAPAAPSSPIGPGSPPKSPPGAGHHGPPARPMPTKHTPAPMNVPTRPTVVKPMGPKLTEVQKPAKLSGPKVVRVEQADVIEAPRPRRGPSDDSIPTSRGPRGGSGVGGGGGGGEDDASRSPRRNKRRAGETASPARPAAGGGRRSAQSESEAAAWRAQDLIEREERLSRSEGFLRQRRRETKLREQGHSERSASPAEKGGKVHIVVPLSIKDLSSATGVKAAEIVKKLFLKGIMATVNSGIDIVQAQEIMMDYDIELIGEAPKSAEDVVAEEFAKREQTDLRPRSPVVTILGHVDHGKTSLLDKIRNANVAAGEAGGITQKTSAFRVPVRVGSDDKSIAFLDTPGHQAFSEMRSRGANMTDIVVLVISAVDGVMPQTIESINHAKAAKVPVVVALNKIDLPQVTDSQIQQIFGKLAEQGLNPTEWGGETEVVRTSAVTGKGIPELLETLDLQAQILDLKADFAGPARGAVVEARLEEGRGATANLLVQEGELKVGDIVVAGRAFGRVRDITDDHGKRIKTAHPSTPVKISGLNELPDAGDKFFIVDSLRTAQDAAEQRQQLDRERELAVPKVTLDSMFAQLKEKEIKELLVVVKADVQGSVDVIKKSVEGVSTDAVKVRVLHAASGGITESDVSLSAASGAVIMGFNVIPSGLARSTAEQKGVEIRTYQVIYELIDDVKKAAGGLLTPDIKEEILGHADVRQVFKVSKVGAIAGCYITDGTIERNAFIRITRNGVVFENARVLEQLKRFKDDVKEVRAGQECGMKIVGYDDIKEGDVLECYRKVEVARTL